MSNMHRIVWFDNQIRAGNYPNRLKISEQFEISIRQAQRDVDYLKDSLRAPLNYDAKKRGYYYEDKTFVIPNIHIKKVQKKLLSFLAYSYENFNQTPQVVEMINLFKALSGNEELSDEIPVFDLENKTINTHHNLSQAINNRKKILIIYKDQYKGRTEFKVHPYKIFRKYKSDYFSCFCEKENEIKVLRIDRIIKINILNEVFQVHIDYKDINYDRSDTIEPYKALIEFTKEPSYKDFIECKLKKQQDYIYEVKFFDIEDLIKELISVDYWTKIHYPKWLKRKIKEKSRRILSRID